ncbi:MAG: cytochrome c oxidase subunit 3 family protein [Bdellovibrionaceae bacterium]|nr:cytochrome c oxidase subunit 3 family protein [Pseudobdellovibrionaceae bacterium]
MSTGNSAAHHEYHHAHHFRDAEHEYQTAKEGIWLFMVTEILMFGGLFVGYAIFHTIYPEMFAEGAKQLDWRMGFVNTLVLIFSSFTMALGILYCQTNQQKKAVMALAATVLCGAIFMVIKYFEYTHKFHLGFYPGRFLDVATVGAQHQNLGMYFGFYFAMTGLHGLHVLIGMALIVWVMIRTMRGEFSSQYYTPVEGVGIFWHIVDLIWIFLFPLLYLVG